MAPPLQNWKIVKRKDLTHDVFEVSLERPQGFEFKGGQYLSIVVPGAGPGGRNLRRAYSIASAPENNLIELCIKLVNGGPGTNYLNSLKEGESLQAQGPFGDFCIDHDQNLPAVFIGTGTGIAPLRSMTLAKNWTSTAKMSFLLGVRSQRDIIYPELFGADRPKAFRNGPVEICLSRPEPGWTGFHGRVTDYLRKMDWNFAVSHYYLCGSGAMLTEIKEFLMSQHSVIKEQIHIEKYY